MVDFDFVGQTVSGLSTISTIANRRIENQTNFARPFSRRIMRDRKQAKFGQAQHVS